MKLQAMLVGVSWWCLEASSFGWQALSDTYRQTVAVAQRKPGTEEAENP
jgi:hypothetical protein